MINILGTALKIKMLEPPHLSLALFVVSLVLLLPACVSSSTSSAKTISSDNYSSNKLAKDWHEHVRQNPENPYENSSYPIDNDNDYNYPNYRTQRIQVMLPTANSIKQNWSYEEGNWQ